jgi:hypothetical protein
MVAWPRLSLLILVISACSSSGTTTPDATSASASDGAVSTPPDLAPATSPDAATAAPDTATAGDVQASEECRKYCDCMAKNCADRMFARGCLVECASQTKWDIPCRQNMCNLVVPQPNNDHCTHALGMGFQCTDKP